MHRVARRSTRVIFGVALVMMLLAPRAIEACSCIAGIPVCQSFWATDAVFSGTVAQITPTPNRLGEPYPSHRLVRFQVKQSWRGAVGPVVEVLTGSGGGDCGFSFEQGVTYLVYAHAGRGGLSTSICSRTRRLSEAAEDLEYLKTALNPSATGRVFGTVRYQGDGSSPPQPDRFIPGYTVELSDGRRTREARTDKNGKYVFTGVPAGPYSVKLATPKTEYAYGPTKITLADPRGCAAADFYVVPDGRLSVRIIDAAGAPARALRIELLEEQQESANGPAFPRQTLETSSDGRIEFARLHPKRYVLAINGSSPPSAKQPYPASYYPGVATRSEAKVIDLSPGERVDLGEWILPAALAERKVTGQVVWPDGKPAAAASILVTVARNGPWRFRSVDARANTDAEGRFTLTLHQGVAYEVSAYANVGSPVVQWNTPRIGIPPSESGTTVRLQLQPPAR